MVGRTGAAVKCRTPSLRELDRVDDTVVGADVHEVRQVVRGASHRARAVAELDREGSARVLRSSGYREAMELAVAAACVNPEVPGRVDGSRSIPERAVSGGRPLGRLVRVQGPELVGRG